MLKNKKQVFKCLSTISLVSIMATGVISFYGILRTPIIEDKYNNLLDESVNTQQYVEYNHKKHLELYDLYKNGSITASEYNARLNNQKTLENLYGNRHEFMTKDMINEIEQAKDSCEFNDSLTKVGLCSNVCSYILAILSKKQIEDYEYKEWQKSHKNVEKEM